MNKQKIRTIISMGLSITMLTFQLEIALLLNTSKVFASMKEINKGEKSADIIIEFETTKDTFIRAYEDRLAQIEEEKRLEEERIKREQEEQRLLEEQERIRKENITVNLDGLLEKSNIRAEELYNTLMFMGKESMAEMAWAIVDAENETSINALFLAGVIAQESAWGTSDRARYQNNVTGYCVYSSQAKGRYFNSKYDCIMETARWLKAEYLSPDGNHFYGYTSYHVNIDYCLTEDGSATNFEWSKSINNIAKTIESYYHKYIR